MKALVTGGAGFIGSNLVDLLLSEGHEVVVLDNLSSGYAENIRPDTEHVSGDVRDTDLARRVAVGCQVIFHLAASVGNTRSIEHPILDSDVNVLGTLSVLEAARTNDIERVVFSSSAGIFGELKTLPISEDHPQEPDSPYGVGKLAAEKHCLVYNKLFGMRNVCLRYFNVYGRRQRYDAYGNVIPIFANRILTGRPIMIFGDGEQTRDFVNAGDVAMANYQAATTAGAHGVFNLGSGTRISINRLAELMQRVFESHLAIEYGPPRKGDVRDSLADITVAREGLRFSPKIDIETGLAEYASWIRLDQVTPKASWQVL